LSWMLLTKFSRERSRIQEPSSPRRAPTFVVMVRSFEDVWPIEVACVDVVDTGSDGLAQNSYGFGAIARRAEDVGAGELHCTVADAMDGERGTGEVVGPAE